MQENLTRLATSSVLESEIWVVSLEKVVVKFVKVLWSDSVVIFRLVREA